MVIKCPHLSIHPSLKHGFFDPQEQQNRGFLKEIGLFPLVTLQQVHGSKVYSITALENRCLQGDGLVTNLPQVALGILTADCGPVLFYDPKNRIIGACHAGWRGARAGIIRETIKAMIDLGAVRSQIYASLGPTIQQRDYEVGPEFPDLIGEPYDLYFLPSSKPNHHYFNLPLYIGALLLQEGLCDSFDVRQNTFKGSFASRRRSLSLGNTYLDNLSVIAIV